MNRYPDRNAAKDSPVSNNGRGLKPENLPGRGQWLGDSPVSNNGRGLKPALRQARGVGRLIRPLAITGVD